MSVSRRVFSSSVCWCWLLLSPAPRAPCPRPRWSGSRPRPRASSPGWGSSRGSTSTTAASAGSSSRRASSTAWWPPASPYPGRGGRHRAGARLRLRPAAGRRARLPPGRRAPRARACNWSSWSRRCATSGSPTSARLGITLLQYYPHHTYLVWAELPARPRAPGRLPFVRWQGAVPPRLQDRRRTCRPGGHDPQRRRDVLRRRRLEATLARIAALGGEVLQLYPSQPDRAFYDAIVQLDGRRHPRGGAPRPGPVARLREPAARPSTTRCRPRSLAGNYPGGTPFTGYSAHLGAARLSTAPA